jgi:hypothetical protein
MKTIIAILNLLIIVIPLFSLIYLLLSYKLFK